MNEPCRGVVQYWEGWNFVKSQLRALGTVSHDDRIVLAQLQDEVQIPQKLARSIHCISSMPLQVAAGILMHCKKKEKREPVPVKPGCGGLVGDVYGSTNRNLPSHVTRQNIQPGLQVSHYCLGVLWKLIPLKTRKFYHLACSHSQCPYAVTCMAKRTVLLVVITPFLLRDARANNTFMQISDCLLVQLRW